MSEQLLIRIDAITPAKDGLRKVNHDDDKFKEMCQSVKKEGILNPPNVIRNPEKPGAYILVDGLHRYTAAAIAGLEEIPCHVLEGKTVDDIPELQIQANIHKIDTRPIEYTRLLQRMMLKHPERSIKEQAARLNQSEGWLRDRLSLNHFEGEAAELIEKGEIKLANAYALAKIAKIAPEEVDDWLERAKTLSPDDFIPEALKREQDLKKALASGKKASDVGPTGPAVKLRKLGDIKTEYNRARSLAVTQPTEFNKGYLAFAEWALSQDQANREAWAKAEAERKAQKEAKAKEREAEKEAKAREESRLSLADLIPKNARPVEETAAAE